MIHAWQNVHVSSTYIIYIDLRLIKRNSALLSLASLLGLERAQDSKQGQVQEMADFFDVKKPMKLSSIPFDGFSKSDIPPVIDPKVVDAVVSLANRVKTIENVPHGALFAIVPSGTSMRDIGELLDCSGATMGFINDRLNVFDNIDEKVRASLSWDGATVVDGSTGTILAVRFKLNPLKRGTVVFDGRGTKHNSALLLTEFCSCVCIVRSDDGMITFITSVMTLSGEAYHLDPVNL